MRREPEALYGAAFSEARKFEALRQSVVRSKERHACRSIKRWSQGEWRWLSPGALFGLGLCFGLGFFGMAGTQHICGGLGFAGFAFARRLFTSGFFLGSWHV